MSTFYVNEGTDACGRKPSGQWNLKVTPLDRQQPVPSDIVVARSITGKPISQLCNEVNVKNFDLYGEFKAKVTQLASTDNSAARGNYVVVTGITPTSFGEGKSTTTIGLVQALTAHLKKNSFACIRQPSQGPTFGMKGGAAGGGYSQVWPMDEFNMHLTGDIHAVTAANNLIAAAIDARMFHESTQNDTDLFRRLVDKPGSGGVPTFTQAQMNRLERLGLSSALKPFELSEEQRRQFARLDLDPETITWTRVIDTNDRFLRKITIGQAPTEKGRTRETKFAISVVSELMAILSLAADFDDVCKRVAKIVLGFSKQDDQNNKPRPVTCEDLCVDGAVCALLKDAIYPTIMQTLEGTPLMVHCGPFANIAHGNSSIIADKLALELVGPNGFVVTEAGFASDIGFEKFVDIKCRYSNLMPDCAVLVSTIRALKMHGRDLLGDKQAIDELALKNGLINMNAHIRNIKENFNVPVVVALNKFKGDTEAELEFVKQEALKAGASDCRIADNWALGGEGGIDLANGVIEACQKQRQSNKKGNFLYDAESLSILEKIKTITSKVYGASDVSIPEAVQKKIELFEMNGFGSLPVCIAKTHLSISHDPKMKGSPSNYTFPIVDINLSAGAGFLYALAGEISTMPGLPTRPAFFDISIDPKSGQIDGLF